MMYSQAIFSLYNPLEFLSFYVNVCIYHISINTSSLFLTSKYSTKSNFLIMPSILFMIFYQQEKAILNKKKPLIFSPLLLSSLLYNFSCFSLFSSDHACYGSNLILSSFLFPKLPISLPFFCHIIHCLHKVCVLCIYIF